MSRIFVTGASGFIGGAIASHLAGEHEVLAMSRSERSDLALKERGAQPVRCDLGTVSATDLAGCDAVVHCAAHVEPWGTREQCTAINVGGTTRLLAAAAGAGTRRFVHMSTEAVLWHGQHLRDVDETCPYPEKTPYLYAETKAEAERRVVAANRPAEGFETLVLRPRFVWGPGDTTIVPEAKKMAEQGVFAWIDGGRARTSTTHVANLVHATELALTRGTPGGIYFVTDGEETDFKSFLGRLLAANGVSLPERSLPGWLMRPAAAALEAVWRALRIRSAPPLTRHAVDLLCCDCTLRDAKARAELGYAPVIDVERGLRELAASMRPAPAS